MVLKENKSVVVTEEGQKAQVGFSGVDGSQFAKKREIGRRSLSCRI